ncbi:hypothetical protein Salat_1948200 [Sesamum alatum]|uniref:Myb/SANT-like domain-containing protein n=1 Tax=Sesamum alatum TaxID=300844 RepID=A0AAE1Y4S0_9LAMI|nr:hypothetical protein Salat_1948200 [Sesamum alatum]
MHHYHTVHFGRWNSSLLSEFQATTVNMWPNGYYHQENMFYFRNWTREMEKTFVDSLVEHARSGLFRPESPNIHAVMSALYDVNKKYGTKITYEWAQSRVERLRERYHLFRWVINTEGVLWNQRLGPNNARNEVFDAGRFDLNAPARADGWVDLVPPRVNEAPAAAPANEAALDDPAGGVAVVDQAPDDPAGEVLLVEPLNQVGPADSPNEALHAEPVPEAAGLPPPVLVISDSSDSSSSMWRRSEEYYASNSSADSVLPVPGVPLGMSKRIKLEHSSPPSQKSGGASSYTASNATPIKKADDPMRYNRPIYDLVIDLECQSCGKDDNGDPMHNNEGEGTSKRNKAAVVDIDSLGNPLTKKEVTSHGKEQIVVDLASDVVDLEEDGEDTD